MAKPLRVLLVEDSEDDAELLLLELRRGGYEPAAERVDTAVAVRGALEGREWDIVISDYAMPNFNGLEALKRMKEKRPELQVILLTGHATVEKGVEAIKLGAMDLVEKPADLEALGEKIKKAKQKKMLIVEKVNEEKVMDALKRYGV